MQLSEAMRLGAMMNPQAFNGHKENGSCALRAVADALGISDTDVNPPGLNYAELYRRYDFLHRTCGCPKCEIEGSIMSIIYHLNDRHRWPRERIADWVETFESATATNAVDPVGRSDHELTLRV